MKRTLKRELKGLEIAKREPFGTSVDASHIAVAIAAAVPWLAASQHRLVRAGERLMGRWAGPCLLRVSRRYSPRGVRRASDRGKVKLRK